MNDNQNNREDKTESTDKEKVNDEIIIEKAKNPNLKELKTLEELLKEMD